MKKRHPSGWRFFYVAVAIGSVGVDAHIDPAVCTIFTELFGEFVRAQRGDVGIAPYAGWGWLNKPYFGASIFLGNCV